MSGVLKAFGLKGSRAPQIPSAGLGLGTSQALSTSNFSLAGGKLTSLDPSTQNSIKSLLGGGLTGANQAFGDAATANIGGIRSGLQGIQGGIQGLRAQVAPGMGEVTASRVRALRDASAQAIGNLRDSLGRRGVMGSSFANDAVSRERQAFTQEEASQRAQGKIEEISISSQLFTQEMTNLAEQLGLDKFTADAMQQQFQNIATQAEMQQRELTRQLNELGVAGGIINQANQISSQVAMAQAEMDMLTKAGEMNRRWFVGTLAKNTLTGAISGAINPGQFSNNKTASPWVDPDA